MSYETLAPVTAGQLVDDDYLNQLAENAEFIATACAARAYRGSVQSIPNNAWTALSLTSESFDTDAIHSTSSNQSRFTLPRAGLWVVSGVVSFDFNASGYRGAKFRINGTTDIAVDLEEPVAESGIDTPVDVECSLIFALNDYVELLGYQNSGGALDASAGADTTFAQVRYVGLA